MKVLRKILVIVLAAILILVIAGVVLVDLFAERAVKYGIEAAATKALNVGVTVDDVDLSLTAGKLVLYGTSISNPPGYQHRKLLELDSARIQVDVRSLLSDVVKIRQIKLDGAEVVLEQKGIMRNNLQDVIKAIPRGPKAEDQAEPTGKKLHIDELEISNTKVKVKLLPLPGRADTISLKLATIRMTNLGSDNKLDAAGLTGKILSAIARGIAEQGAGILPDDVVNGLSTALGKTLDLGKDVIKGGADVGKKVIEGAGDAGKKILEGAGDIGKGIGDGLKGLLKPKAKDEEE